MSPRQNPASRKTASVYVALAKEEVDSINGAAVKDSRTVSDWMRVAIFKHLTAKRRPAGWPGDPPSPRRWAIPVRVMESQRVDIKAAATRLDTTVSDFMRGCCLLALKEQGI